MKFSFLQHRIKDLDLIEWGKKKNGLNLSCGHLSCYARHADHCLFGVPEYDKRMNIGVWKIRPCDFHFLFFLALCPYIQNLSTKRFLIRTYMRIEHPYSLKRISCKGTVIG